MTPELAEVTFAWGRERLCNAPRYFSSPLTNTLLGVRFNLLLLMFAVVVSRSGMASESSSTESRMSRLPNVIVIVADDLGYGDTSGNGHPTIETPNLDRMAHEGQKWTQFYVAASVCSPSRAALLTGRLPIRSGIASLEPRVFFPWSGGGLSAREWTIAELFKAKNYATALIGKWHLGHLPEFLPTRHGFDEWFGIPYSNDMDKTVHAKKLLRRLDPGNVFPPRAWYEPKSEWFNVPLMRGGRVLERAPDQSRLTQRYATESLKFIRRHRKEPFFLYLAFSMPHVPLFRSPEFAGRSKGGLYGDVIEELDAAVGVVLDELRALEIDQETLVVFTSDNGPWLKYKTLGGSAGPLREGKSTAWEGGFRVPGIFWAPGMIAPGVVHQLGSTLDFMATFAALTNSELPASEFDSFDLMPVLRGHEVEPRDEMFFYLGDQLAAVRQGAFKAHFCVAGPAAGQVTRLSAPLLFDLEEDPGERFDLAASKPEVVEALTRLRDSHSASIVPVENQLIRGATGGSP